MTKTSIPNPFKQRDLHISLWRFIEIEMRCILEHNVRHKCLAVLFPLQFTKNEIDELSSVI